MPVRSFEFQPDFAVNPDTKKLNVVYRPYVPIKLGNKNKWSRSFIRALVDSGADINVFPVELALEIGIDYKRGIKRQIIGVGKQEVDSYIHIVKLKIDKREFDTVIQFSDQIQIPLLGREGFFNYFDRITFNVKRRFLELKY